MQTALTGILEDSSKQTKPLRAATLRGFVLGEGTTIIVLYCVLILFTIYSLEISRAGILKRVPASFISQSHGQQDKDRRSCYNYNLDL